MKSILVSILVSIGLLLPVHAAAEPVASVPYRIDYNGWFTVEVMVNGQGPYDFIIDTGATQSLAFQNLADEVDFLPTGGDLQTVLGMAAQGSFPPYLLGEFSVGDASLPGIISVILPDWEVDDRPSGIIGLDFLRRYIVVFDAKEGIVHFYSRARPPPDDLTRKWRKVTVEPDNFGLESDYLYTVEGRINSRRVRFLVDLGASGTVVNRSAVASVVKSGIAVTVRPSGAGETRQRIIDALGKSEEARTLRVNRFKVGKNYWYRFRFWIHDAEIFKELGVNGKPFGLFGADLVDDRSFLLDFEGGRMLIGKRTKNGPAKQTFDEREAVAIESY